MPIVLWDTLCCYEAYGVIPNHQGTNVRRDVCPLRAGVRRFPHGVVDDVESIAALTSAKGVGLHVDNCLGGFLLSHLQAIGAFTRPFDFEVRRCSMTPQAALHSLLAVVPVLGPITLLAPSPLERVACPLCLL